jgi:hypothetical protein
MGIVKVFLGLPVHLKALAVTIIGLIGLWIVVTPLYLEILSWNDSIPVYIWMIIGIGLILFAAKFGKMVL